MGARRPVSLLRRLMLALGLAFVLVQLVLTGYNYARFKHSVSDHAALLKLARVMVQGLRIIEQPADAATVAATADIMLNASRADPASNQGHALAPLWLELRAREGGQRLYASAALGEQALLGQAGRVQEQRLQGRLYWVAQVDDARWSLRLATVGVADSTALAWIASDLLPNLLIAFPFALLPVVLVVWRGLRPLSQLSAQLQQARGDDLSPLVVDERYTEIRTVGVAFNAVLGRLRERLALERARLQDTAHELRTPMAVMAAQAHWLLQADSEADRQAAHAGLQQAIERASHLTQQLLVLAALDEARPAPDARPVDVAELCRQSLAAFSLRALAAGVELDLDSPDSLAWPLPASAWQSMLDNLLDNALRYGPRQGGGCRSRWPGRTTGPCASACAMTGPASPRRSRPTFLSALCEGGGSRPVVPGVPDWGWPSCVRRRVRSGGRSAWGQAWRGGASGSKCGCRGRSAGPDLQLRPRWRWSECRWTGPLDEAPSSKSTA